MSSDWSTFFCTVANTMERSIYNVCMCMCVCVSFNTLTIDIQAVFSLFLSVSHTNLCRRPRCFLFLKPPGLFLFCFDSNYVKGQYLPLFNFLFPVFHGEQIKWVKRTYFYFWNRAKMIRDAYSRKYYVSNTNILKIRKYNFWTVNKTFFNLKVFTNYKRVWWNHTVRIVSTNFNQAILLNDKEEITILTKESTTKWTIFFFF